MELVYLWVEKYKNIEKQGFNFSPKFNCHYDGETLTIKNNVDEDGNKKYIENFFGDNINVTAIVGKNGSGKSSILNTLEDIFESISINKNEYILCFFSENKIFILSEREINNDFERVSEIPAYLLVSYPEILTHHYEEPKYKDKRSNEITFQESKINEIISDSNNKDFQISTFMMIPEKVYVKQNSEELKDLLDIDGIKPIPKVYDEDFYNKSCIKNCYKERELYGTNHILEAFCVNEIIKNGDCQKLFKNYLDTLKNHDESSEYEYVLELDRKIIMKLYKKINKNNYLFKEFDYLIKKKEFTLKSVSKKDKLLLEKYKSFLTFDYEDINKCRYSDLSYGEQIIYGQLLNIYNFVNRDKNNVAIILGEEYKVNQKEKDKLVILLDEPMNSLHPQWQKLYIKELLSLNNKMDVNIHFIITSHSPFLLSDIPKQNIIFLDKKENGNCKVLNHNEVLAKKQTFGANIHTLLSDSFFMEGGLMGEFAKQKINEIIAFFKKENEIYKDDKEKLLKIINTIGEPFLKDKLLFMYNEKYPKTKEEEIAELEDKLKRLKNG